MSTGFATTPLLKAAPQREQLADRLDEGGWRGIEIALMPHHIADDDALALAATVTQQATEGLVVTAYPGLLAHTWDEELELDRYVEELGPHAEVAHLSDAHGLLGEGLPYGAGELDLDPVARRLGELVPFIVAEINEADPARSVEMKRAYRAIERALELPPVEPKPARRRVPTDSFDWQQVLERRDPVPSVLELQERFGGRRILL